MNKSCIAGVTVSGEPVKYLGAYLGSGDLTAINFEAALKKARAVASRWSKRKLTITARVLVLKTFIFSIFVHTLNSVWIKPSQVDLIQKILLDFLWGGRFKLKLSTITSPVSEGGLKMLHVKNVLHTLQVKWMHRLTQDLGLSWSRFIWPLITKCIPPNLFGGMRQISESELKGLPLFYADMLHSYCRVNNLFYLRNDQLALPHNLWMTLGIPKLHPK